MQFLRLKNKPEWNGQNNAEYATMVENHDMQIGRLITSLKVSGKLENTFILSPILLKNSVFLHQ